jgi:hypothetical protein
VNVEELAPWSPEEGFLASSSEARAMIGGGPPTSPMARLRVVMGVMSSEGASGAGVLRGLAAEGGVALASPPGGVLEGRGAGGSEGAVRGGMAGRLPRAVTWVVRGKGGVGGEGDDDGVLMGIATDFLRRWSSSAQ